MPVTDRGFLFGDGVFTSLRVFQGRPECLGLHLDRLKDHCHQLKITPPEIKNEWIREIIARNNANLGEWRLKIIVTGGNAARLDLRERKSGGVLMTMKRYSGTALTPRKLALYPDPICRPHAHVKTLAYLDRLWVMDYAKSQGCDDAVIVDPKGVWLETAFSNLFWRDGDELIIPHVDLPLLYGVAIRIVVMAAKALNMSTRQVKARREEVPVTAQLFVCNSISGICPVVEVGGKPYSRDPYFEQEIRSAYADLIRHL